MTERTYEQVGPGDVTRAIKRELREHGITNARVKTVRGLTVGPVYVRGDDLTAIRDALAPTYRAVGIDDESDVVVILNPTAKPER